MFNSVKVRILCIFVLFSLVHTSQADTNTIEVLKRIETQLVEFKRKYENEQQRIRDFVSLTLREFQEEACYNATIETFIRKDDHDPFGNFNILRIELDLASLLSDSGKLSEPTVETAEKQGCECEKAYEIIRQDMVNRTDVQTNRLINELKSQFETQKKSYEEANIKLNNTHQIMLNSLSKSQDASNQIRNKLDNHLETLTLSQNNSIDELATRLSNELKTQFETQKKSIQKGLPNLCGDCDCAISNGNGPGVYQILIFNKVTSVYCDAFGKMMIQHQMEGPADFFNRTWIEFKNGFGKPHAQFWMGLEYIHQLTSLHRYELHILMVYFDNVTTHVVYDDFQIGDERDLYRINNLGTFTGNETLNSLQINMPFSTVDKDSNRNEIKYNCALGFKSGWWYYDNHPKYCSVVILNLKVRTNVDENPGHVLHWSKDGKELKEVSMYIKLH